MGRQVYVNRPSSALTHAVFSEDRVDDEMLDALFDSEDVHDVYRFEFDAYPVRLSSEHEVDARRSSDRLTNRALHRFSSITASSTRTLSPSSRRWRRKHSPDGMPSTPGQPRPLASTRTFWRPIWLTSRAQQRQLA